jgi:lipid A 3-O-deacylase
MDQPMRIQAVPAALSLCILASLCQAEPTGAANDAQDTSSFDSFIKQIEPFTVTGYWENDGTILKRNNSSDRHYTNGIAFTFTHQPAWAEGFADTLTLDESFNKTAAGYIIGHQIFTPELLNASTLQRKDRPYAGYAFAGAYLQRANNQVFDHAQLDLGIVGPSSQADHIQHDFHDWFDADIPRGWDHQLRNEFTAQLTLRRKWRFDMEPIVLMDTSLDHQVIPQVELAAGSVYRHVAAGATWRFGINLPDDFGPGRLADVASATGTPSKSTGGYGFVRVAGRAVEHNLFLEGNSYKSSHGVDAETLVAEIQAGIAVYGQYEGWQLQANYSQTFITEQFDGQDGADSYGAFTLSASHGF